MMGLEPTTFCMARVRELQTESAGKPLSLRLLRCPCPVPIGVDGQCDVAMSELLRDPSDLGATLERKPCERMPERVEVTLATAFPDAMDARPLERRIEDMPEDVARRKVPALLPLEHSAATLAVGVPGL